MWCCMPLIPAPKNRGRPTWITQSSRTASAIEKLSVSKEIKVKKKKLQTEKRMKNKL